MQSSDVVDEELSSAVVAYYDDARHEWGGADYTERRDLSLPAIRGRFFEAVGPERAPQLWVAVNDLITDAYRVRKPGGPISRYGEALEAWLQTHPELSRRAGGRIINRLLYEDR